MRFFVFFWKLDLLGSYLSFIRLTIIIIIIFFCYHYFLTTLHSLVNVVLQSNHAAGL